MHQFKVGDTVRAVTSWEGWLVVGRLYKVAEVGRWYVRIDGPYGRGGFSPSCFEVVKPTLADELTLKPSTRTVLAHLKAKGSITVMEALAAYGMTRIAPQIFELREFGVGIDTISKKDAAGHKYTRYAMKKAA
jgi:ABC-type Fe3+ transport system substrate-binding protein